MVSQDRISRLAQQIGERLQGASQAPEDIQKGVQQVVRGAFDRLELVSREDFDILMDVLQRTRSRVEALEKQVAALESLVEERAAPAGETAAAPAVAEEAAEVPVPTVREQSKQDEASSGSADKPSA
ncbi:accessory factor UbiK family protein [Halomonas sp. YLB-10]|uniref:accessory factor UbiK family protein n=1 Tax=Halomonas sp. YLB-10 TaxID=2483111 RepID=UPI000F5E736D|nr:accessory factor UbiK family protein [Halomonas sp. YLB-10]RQW70107.1 accessory factor UbiK family protein [Halomonas sp. YLB-10]